MPKISDPTHPSDAFVVEAYVTQSVKLLGLSIPPEQMASVIENFKGIQAIAQPVLDFPLPDTLEAAPTFDP